MTEDAWERLGETKAEHMPDPPHCRVCREIAPDDALDDGWEIENDNELLCEKCAALVAYEQAEQEAEEVLDLEIHRHLEERWNALSIDERSLIHGWEAREAIKACWTKQYLYDLVINYRLAK